MMSSRAIAWRKLRFRFDWFLMLAMLAMVALGLVNLWSALQDRGPQLFSKQISLLAVGIGMFLAVAAFDYRAVQPVADAADGAGAALLIAVLLFGRVVGG